MIAYESIESIYTFRLLHAEYMFVAQRDANFEYIWGRLQHIFGRQIPMKAMTRRISKMPFLN